MPDRPIESPETGLEAAQGIILAVLPCVAGWIVLALILWAVL